MVMVNVQCSWWLCWWCWWRYRVWVSERCEKNINKVVSIIVVHTQEKKQPGKKNIWKTKKFKLEDFVGRSFFLLHSIFCFHLNEKFSYSIFCWYCCSLTSFSLFIYIKNSGSGLESSTRVRIKNKKTKLKYCFTGKLFTFMLIISGICWGTTFIYSFYYL